MNQKAPEQTASHEPGIDGRGLFVLAWCSCGWNRTKATRRSAGKAITEHLAARMH